MRSIWRDDVPRTTNPLSFFLFVSKPHIRMALLSSFLVVCAAGLTSLIPYVYKLVTEGTVLLANGAYQSLVIAVSLYFCISLGSHLLWRASGFAGMQWATGMRATARSALFSHLSHHSYQFFSNRFAGSLLSKLKQAGDGSKEMVNMFLWDFLSFFVTLVTSFIIVFTTSFWAGLILFAFLFVIVPFNFYLSKKRIPISIAAQNAETVLNGATVDAIANMVSVHEYVARDAENERLKSLNLRRRALGIKNWQFSEWLLLWNGVFVNIFFGGMVFFAIYLAVQGVIAPGDIVLLLATVWLLEGYFVHLSQRFNNFSELWGQVSESLQDILHAHEVSDTENAKTLAVEGGNILFKDVSFEYDGKSVFNNLSFDIKKGERVGIVGRSGAGKTTLVKLILRHYDLLGGSINIDDTNIAEVTKDSLRKNIAVVPQDPALFHRTIYDNIAYGKKGAGRADVFHAAKLAQAHEFILSLPEGYDAMVGERGVKLSGGQRQRIAIARAFAKDAPILLLDEATSALDSESEGLVQEALLKLMEGRTVLAIAHRLSTLRAMDRILVFDKGQIIEDGSHDALIAQGGVYADLWNHQAGGFLNEDQNQS